MRPTTPLFFVLLPLCAAPLALAIDQPREFPTDPYAPAAQPIRTSRPSTDRGLGGPVQVNVTAAGLNILADAANEPSLCVDPVDPRRMSVGWRQFDTITSNFRQAGRAFSRDAGRTWTAAPVLEPGVFRSDPVLRSDADGRFYYLSLKVTGTLTCQVFRSLDGGATFPDVFEAFGGDKAWLAIDLTTGPNRGSLFQQWSTQWTRSFDRGMNWTTPTAGNPVWGQSLVGPDSALNIIGVATPGSSSDFRLARMTDAGNPLAAQVLSTSPFTLNGPLIFNTAAGPNPGGLAGQVVMAIDQSTGPRRGWIYVAAPVDPTGIDPADIRFTRSTDNGLTWSTPIRVNTSTPTASDWQWFAAIDVSPNGRIDLVFNDTRESQNAVVSRLYSTSSSDGGTTWTPDAPIGPSFNSTVGWPSQNKIGDYSDINSDELGANVIVSETINNEQDVWFYRIGPRLCPGDFNRSGSVSPQDIFDFLAAWFAGNIRADYSRDFTIGVQDIFTFLALWFAP